MAHHSDSYHHRWPENCEGSREALEIFVGPSPGGSKKHKRHEIVLNIVKPLWNEPYNDPLNWGGGFKTSFKPIVETIFQKPYEEAAKLIARVNMDWMGNPESQNVSYRYMWEGCAHILPVIAECHPELVIPMDEKTFGVLKIALSINGYDIVPPRSMGKIKVLISKKNGKPRYHHSIMAFKAQKKGSSFLVIKSLQHPARIFDHDYAQRVGEAITTAANQLSKGIPLHMDI